MLPPLIAVVPAASVVSDCSAVAPTAPPNVVVPALLTVSDCAPAAAASTAANVMLPFAPAPELVSTVAAVSFTASP